VQYDLNQHFSPASKRCLTLFKDTGTAIVPHVTGMDFYDIGSSDRLMGRARPAGGLGK
jgi:hypothetical protein